MNHTASHPFPGKRWKRLVQLEGAGRFLFVLLDLQVGTVIFSLKRDCRLNEFETLCHRATTDMAGSESSLREGEACVVPSCPAR